TFLPPGVGVGNLFAIEHDQRIGQGVWRDLRLVILRLGIIWGKLRWFGEKNATSGYSERCDAGFYGERLFHQPVPGNLKVGHVIHSLSLPLLPKRSLN